MPTPTKYNVTATYKTLWDRSITLRDSSGQALDLTGMGALFQVRASVDAPLTLIEASTLPTSAGTITIDGGTLRIEIDPDQMDVTPGAYVYGIALIDGQGRLNEPFLEGTFTVRRGLPAL